MWGQIGDSQYKYHVPSSTSISLTMFSLLTGLLSLALLAEANIEGQVCTNASYYGEVEYTQPETPCCSTHIAEPDCVEYTETACVNVTETVCKVGPLSLLGYYIHHS